jgi:hypothetical protein
MDVPGTEELAAELLGVPSIAALAREQVARALLPDGRVEAHEYGRRQHSSASAGGVLIGLSGSYGVPDSVIAPLSRVVSALIDGNGRVRSHDGDVESGDSTWAQAQVLLGLLLRPRLVTDLDKLVSLTKRLLAQRDGSGGWPLRAGEKPSRKRKRLMSSLWSSLLCCTMSTTTSSPETRKPAPPSRVNSCCRWVWTCRPRIMSPR